MSKSTSGEKAAVGIMAVSGLALIAGAIFYGKSRRSKQRQLSGGSGFGDILSKTKRGGMTLMHHYDAEMPIQKRIKIMQDLVWAGVQDPQMRELALAITGNGVRDVKVGKRMFRVRGAACPARDGLCEAEAVFNWTKANVRYSGDVAPVKMPSGAVEGIDLFQTAKRTSEFGAGDCDDNGIVNSTLLSLNGIPSKFRVTAPSKNVDFQHVYSLAGLPKSSPTKWIALDTTLPGNNMFSREAPHGHHVDFVA
jgi:hypothetical protein